MMRSPPLTELQHVFFRAPPSTLQAGAFLCFSFVSSEIIIPPTPCRICGLLLSPALLDKLSCGHSCVLSMPIALTIAYHLRDMIRN